ncbi:MULTISPECIES: ferredoxin--NADP reductase [Rhodococcus]|uniref:Ferredoxin--NADP reductase n=1 Tax=Rhodococcus oxybenzonivorans TaxID=1990687 RepID=A0AAE5A910_9NOCA|nr:MULTISPECIES: ferredoxin--NADP reductase [Rhodococcus]MDV7241007.1 ferredoxin--NADP reductase [Rhodococcus oxybenzonivorans]MDV7267339.1 ferredoxin--NADP reductase [Rhodococcus oxybenzonivorans]MDV7273280.1 ferredoxin--NADP reductase [Rhodococcus oxybenzonivorans]MDV7332982.1 ferredoxin--NADP reductase [Rhodococcus oxybenzonivorans]MDV7342148.1 ferredoxin--NADP reductase [Rhodococcus oxybenzonivorans]
MSRPPLFQRATVTRIVKESSDARTLVLAPHDGPFSYRAGQFCTFRVDVDGTELFRSYSMSSAPETDGELMTTVKRVPGGKVSNWLHDNVAEGDAVELTRPAGTFCLRPTSAPLLGFSGGSGITPILSLAKSALATTDRHVRLLCADRDHASVMFDAVLNELTERYPDRFSFVRHLDDRGGFLDAAAVRHFVGAEGDADSYLCGPEPFMALVESALPGPGRIFSERFGAAAPTAPSADAPDSGVEGTVSIVLGRKKVSVPRKANETLLESARRAGLTPPFSCESGNCATCIATVTEGSATMRVNDALSDDEVAEGYVLTCQAVPDTGSIKVRYE